MAGSMVSDAGHRDGAGAGAPVDAGVWPYAFAVLTSYLRRAVWLIVALAVVGALAGLAVRSALPPRFVSTAQLLIDPRSLQVFQNEMVNSQLDANSAINFVESQMQLLTSERVLSRVIREEKLAEDPAFQPVADGEETPAEGATDLRPSLGADGEPVDAKALTALRRMLTVKRGERSFLVDVTATARTPELAARIANAVVKAFMAEDAATRADAGRRLTSELDGRLAALRERLNASEVKVENFRVAKGLLVTGDKLVSEQRLEEAVTELGASQNRLARAVARVDQLEKAKRDIGSVGALTATEDIRTLSYLIERLSAARENLADLRLNLGPRHPALTSAQSRVDEIERRIKSELDRIREASKVEVERARGEQRAISRTVADLSAELSRARKSQIELGALEQEVKANRDLLAAFEARSREADEFGRISAINLRIVSVALPAEGGSRLVAFVVFAVLGATLGALIGVACVALWAMIAIGRSGKIRRASAAPKRPLAEALSRARVDGGVEDPAGPRPRSVLAAQ
jgi:uncharacterized protein involved in exopolysaccharide biosynthesis